jgi:hypothetical protein
MDQLQAVDYAPKDVPGTPFAIVVEKCTHRDTGRPYTLVSTLSRVKTACGVHTYQKLTHVTAEGTPYPQPEAHSISQEYARQLVEQYGVVNL